MRRITVAVGLLMLMGGFQNCADTRFSQGSAESNNDKGTLTQMDIDADDASGSISQTGQPKKHGHGDCQSDGGQAASGANDDAGDLVACILVDHGKSLKLGYTDDTLSGVNAVSQSACISRHACLEIVPQLFEVEGAYERGYCEHNPNVARLSDTQVQNLVDKALSLTQ